jgi:hypothetical protein
VHHKLHRYDIEKREIPRKFWPYGFLTVRKNGEGGTYNETVHRKEFRLKASTAQLGRSLLRVHNTHIRNINTHIKLYIPLFLPLAQITPLATPNIQHKQPPILIDLLLGPLGDKLADENTLDPIIEFAEAVDAGFLTGFPAAVFAVIVVLANGFIDRTIPSSLEVSF